MKVLIVLSALAINSSTANAGARAAFKSSVSPIKKVLQGSEKPAVRLDNLWYSTLKGKKTALSSFLGKNTPQADLSEAKFYAVKFKDTTIPQSNFSGSTMFIVTFDNVAMPNSKLLDIQINESVFYTSDMSGSDFSGARFTGVKLDDMILEKSILNGVSINNFRIYRSNAALAKFEDSTIDNFTSYKTNMQGTSFRGSSIRGSNFVYVDLRGSDFTNVEMFNVIFKDSDLRGAKLDGITGQNIYYTEGTIFPTGFSPENAGMTLIKSKEVEIIGQLLKTININEL